MTILSSRLTSFGGLAMALALKVATSPAMAVKCGDTITNKTVLTADLICTCGDYSSALTVNGPATLDLNGHTVTCTPEDPYDTIVCLIVSGKGATIKNGIVSGCIYGINNPGAVIDSVLIKDIIAFDNRYDSIKLYGNNNRVLNVTIKATDTETENGGINLAGDNNQVKDCFLSKSIIFLSGNNITATSNIIEDTPNTCLYSDRGSVIKNNTFRRCGWNGVNVGATNSSIVGNKFYSVAGSSIYASDSFYAESFTSTRIAGNRIYKSGFHGINFWAVRNVVVDSNVIVDSGENGINFDPLTRRCTIKNNTIRKCGMSGLRIRGADANNFTNNKISFCTKGINAGAGSARNRMINNRASNNTLFDLSDSSANCGSNVWKGNTGKGNIACTQKK